MKGLLFFVVVSILLICISPRYADRAIRAEGSTHPLKLQAVAGQGDQAHCLINGVLLTKGDNIAGYTVLDIGPNFVQIAKKAGRWTLILEEK
jgi:hypothetical protein